MDYSKKLQFHYKPKKGWINDPNGLVYFKGYYHIFYQHAPNHELPWKEPFIWGHAITKDFLHYEELPIALNSDKNYDNFGCWSGTAIVKDDTLYLIYSSVHMPDGQTEGEIQTISVAYSKDGINFIKYDKNPVIGPYPIEGSHDFRDPAISFVNGKYYLIVATGHNYTKQARLLLYESDDLFNYKKLGILDSWENSKCAECPSLINITDNECILSSSVCKLDGSHLFEIKYGHLSNNQFSGYNSGNFEKGPDEYAGQLFKDHLGRIIMLTWIPGWKYRGFYKKDIGCLSIPREITIKNGKICGYPIKEVQHLLKDSDPNIVMTENGFIIKRENREPIIHVGKVDNIKILKDEYVMEVFVNYGEIVYAIVL